MKKLLVAATAFFVATQVFAGPFGLSQGLSIEEATKLGQFVPGESEHTYVAKLVTNGDADFETYSIFLTPKQGLCAVAAVSKDMYTNAYGHQLKFKFKELTGALMDKYGVPQLSIDVSRTFKFSKNFDFLNLDGMWIEDDTWMEDLLNKKRKLHATWEASSRAVHSPELTTGSSLGLPDSLSFVALNTHARSVSRGYVRIEYRFSNYEACLEAVKLKKHANL